MQQCNDEVKGPRNQECLEECQLQNRGKGIKLYETPVAFLQNRYTRTKQLVPTRYKRGLCSLPSWPAGRNVSEAGQAKILIPEHLLQIWK